MHDKITKLLLFGLLTLWLPCSLSAAPDARQIMQQVNDRDDGDNSSADLTMTLIDRSGNQRQRRIRSFNKDKG